MNVVTIEKLGARGDGVAVHAGKTLHIPFALPGEQVEFSPETQQIARLIAPSRDRIAPFCRHFGVCGGCKMQHLAPAPYAAWKRDLVVASLAGAGVETEIAPLVSAHGAGRRRVTFHVVFGPGGARAGFMVAKTHDLIDLDACPVLTPALAGAADIARAVAKPLGGLGKPLDVQVTDTLGGLDVDIRGAGKGAEAHRLRLTEIAEKLDLARLAIHGVTVVERRAPLLAMGRAMVNAPPGGFLQATALGEETLAALVDTSLGKAKKIADLFSGAGPFALRLAEKRSVTAVDSDAPAIAALTRAARATPGLKPIVAEARDLFRRPLFAHELKAFDAVVLDPPRAGAEAQVRQCALAKAPARIVYVSCDRDSFTRDAAILVNAGWKLSRLTPVDQFAYTPHVELVGLFER